MVYFGARIASRIDAMYSIHIEGMVKSLFDQESNAWRSALIVEDSASSSLVIQLARAWMDSIHSLRRGLLTCEAIDWHV